LTEDSGDMSAALVPVFIDSRLDQRDIGRMNCSCSDGDWQHEDYISEQMRGRQQIMHKKQKILSKFWSENRPCYGLK
jgi:hypothetical protein